MTTPEDAKKLFVEAQATFAPVVGAPNDDDVKRLNEAFVNALQSIDVPGGAVNLSDILLSGDDHKDKHGNMIFERTETSLKSYNDGIAADATNAVRAKAERLGNAKIDLQRLIKTIKRAGRAFLVAVVKETWILPLKEESTFYNKVPLRDFSPVSKATAAALRPPIPSPSFWPCSAGGPTTSASPSALTVSRTHKRSQSGRISPSTT